MTAVLDVEEVDNIMNMSIVHLGLFRADDLESRAAHQIVIDPLKATVTLDARVFHAIARLVGEAHENQQPMLEAVTQLQGNANRLSACEGRVRNSREILKMAVNRDKEAKP